MCSLKDWLDLLTAVAAAVAAIAAARGVTSWRKQHQANAGLETARATLRALLTLRDRVWEFRSPEVWMLAMMGVEPGTGSKVELELVRQGREELAAAQSELQAQMIECEALWGPAFVTPSEAFWDVVLDLQYSVSGYLMSRKPDVFGETDEEERAAKMAEAYGVIKSTGTHKNPDAFEERFNSAVARLEDFLRLKLEGK